MTFEDEEDGEIQSFTDSPFFLMCLVPLRITFTLGGRDHVIWNNDLPSSVTLCRPIKMLFKKENAATTRKEVEKINRQLDGIQPTCFEINGRSLKATPKLILSMVDGKIVNDLTETSSQSCHICGLSGMALSNAAVVLVPETQYEVLPLLHAYIRSMEFLLNISYRIPLKKWRISRGNETLKNRQLSIRGE